MLNYLIPTYLNSRYMFLSRQKLVKLGFADLGKNVLISDKASIYSPEKISIKSNVRIDDFCILSGTIELGNYVHIGCYTSLIGHALICLEDFAGLSQGVRVFSSSDDYSGRWMSNPTIPEEYKNTHTASVVIGKHALVGAASIVLPGVSLGEGASVGALSLVKQSVPEWEVWGGNPLRFLKKRHQDILKLEKHFLWPE